MGSCKQRQPPDSKGQKTHIVVKLGADTGCSNVPYDTATVCSDADKHHALALSTTTKQINESQSLNTLAVLVTFKTTDNFALDDVDNPDTAVGTTDSHEIASWRDSQSSDTALGFVLF
jgi:hypothetical protein